MNNIYHFGFGRTGFKTSIVLMTVFFWTLSARADYCQWLEQGYAECHNVLDQGCTADSLGLPADKQAQANCIASGGQPGNPVSFICLPQISPDGLIKSSWVRCFMTIQCSQQCTENLGERPLIDGEIELELR